MVDSVRPKVLIEQACSAFFPLASAMPSGATEVLSMGNSNDAAVLLPQLLVLMIRSLETLQLPLILEACELEDEGKQV